MYTKSFDKLTICNCNYAGAQCALVSRASSAAAVFANLFLDNLRHAAFRLTSRRTTVCALRSIYIISSYLVRALNFSDPVE